MSPSSVWLSLEVLPSLTAILPVWRALTGDDFPALRALCLDPSDRVATIYPCRTYRICGFRIIRQPDGSITGHCESRPPKCPDVQFSESDVAVLELNWQKLGRAICKAFGLDYKFADLGIWKTYQIGTWSADAVPVILSIKHEIKYQQFAIAELVSTLNQKFILFAPTNRTMDAPCLQKLNRVHAEFFPLGTNVTLTSNGTLHAVKTPGELFAAFNPQVDPEHHAIARKSLDLARSLADQHKFRKAPLLTVFLLYCADGLSPDEIANRCHCARSLVFSRIAFLRAKIGVALDALRLHAGYPEQLEDLRDHRAKKIFPRKTLE